MDKNKTRITAIAVIVALIATITLVLFNRQNNNNNAKVKNPEMILFYSLSCPHCQNIEQYINDNQIKEKYSFIELEISDNQKNSAKLIQIAKDCGYNTNNLGVPFLWTGKNCLMGDKDIIDFFKS
ncbi:hypothetical protein JXE04_02175 [Patescibacteria group bacterium]|nr:hypothetical protein [Patescibacteria group bacterium]